MERLTKKERNSNGTAISKESMIDREGYPTVSDYASKVLTKLAAYEDAEEQGLLLRLPCYEAYSKSGDYVYFIYEGEVIECVHCGLKIDSVTGKGYITLAAGNDYPYLDEEVSKIGETLFFTREQAEAKLAEMEGAE